MGTERNTGVRPHGSHVDPATEPKPDVLRRLRDRRRGRGRTTRPDGVAADAKGNR